MPIPNGTRVTIERVDDVGYSAYAICRAGKSLGIGMFAVPALARAWADDHAWVVLGGEKVA